MTDFREDLEYWTDEVVSTNKDLALTLDKLCDNPRYLDPEDLRFLRNTLERLNGQVHWLDRTVNHYPTPPKKFWQFWK